MYVFWCKLIVMVPAGELVHTDPEGNLPTYPRLLTSAAPLVRRSSVPQIAAHWGMIGKLSYVVSDGPAEVQERQPVTLASLRASGCEDDVTRFASFFTWSVRSSQIDVVAILIQQLRVDLSEAWDQRNWYNGGTALHIAVHPGMVKLLLANGAPVNAKDNNGCTPLHNPAKGTAEFLVARGADVNARDMSGRVPLHFAARDSHAEDVVLLTGHGAEVNANDNYKQTPLHYASRTGDAAVVAALIANGVDVTRKDNRQKTPHYYAKSAVRIEVLALLAVKKQ